MFDYRLVLTRLLLAIFHLTGRVTLLTMQSHVSSNNLPMAISTSQRSIDCRDSYPDMLAVCKFCCNYRFKNTFIVNVHVCTVQVFSKLKK